ncbi:hypothetical protein GQ457_14G019900 [Hibiscus cannabinus]
MEKKRADCDYRNVPPSGYLKFNTDGAEKGCYGLAVIGGVLSDHSGKILAEFSKSIGLADPTSAEILAIKEALIIFPSSEWVKKVELIIKADCEVTIRREGNFKADRLAKAVDIGLNLYSKQDNWLGLY